MVLEASKVPSDLTSLLRNALMAESKVMNINDAVITGYYYISC